MQQELSDLLWGLRYFPIIVGGGVAGGYVMATFISAAILYKDSKRYHAHTDDTRQQVLGEPRFLGFLKQAAVELPRSVVSKELNDGQGLDQKYFNAYLESIREKESTT